MAIISSDLIIDAHAAQVFEALTQPELMKQWQFGRTVITDWKEGSEIWFRTEMEDKVLEQWGTILELRKNELIKYNLFTPSRGTSGKEMRETPENYFTTTYLLSEVEGKTKVEIKQEYKPGGFEPATLLPVLVALKKVVEQHKRMTE